MKFVNHRNNARIKNYNNHNYWIIESDIHPGKLVVYKYHIFQGNQSNTNVVGHGGKIDVHVKLNDLYLMGDIKFMEVTEVVPTSVRQPHIITGLEPISEPSTNIIIRQSTTLKE